LFYNALLLYPPLKQFYLYQTFPLLQPEISATRLMDFLRNLYKYGPVIYTSFITSGLIFEPEVSEKGEKL
jgi:hypothetical protein